MKQKYPDAIVFSYCTSFNISVFSSPFYINNNTLTKFNKELAREEPPQSDK